MSSGITSKRSSLNSSFITHQHLHCTFRHSVGNSLLEIQRWNSSIPHSDGFRWNPPNRCAVCISLQTLTGREDPNLEQINWREQEWVVVIFYSSILNNMCDSPFLSAQYQMDIPLQRRMWIVCCADMVRTFETVLRLWGATRWQCRQTRLILLLLLLLLSSPIIDIHIKSNPVSMSVSCQYFKISHQAKIHTTRPRIHSDS